MGDLALGELLFLINFVWEKREIQHEWKHAVVIPILTPGKEASRPESCRPIALTAVICKIMERMGINQLVYFLERKGFFCSLSEWV